MKGFKIDVKQMWAGVWVLGISCVFTAAAIGLLYLGGTRVLTKHPPDSAIIGFFTLWLTFFAGLIVFVCWTLVSGAVKRQSRGAFGFFILAAYIGHVMCFACAYMLLSFVLDFKHVLKEHLYYSRYEKMYESDYSHPFARDWHGLTGIAHPMWELGVQYDPTFDPDADYVDVKARVEAAKTVDPEQFAVFNGGALGPAFIEHLYFSVVTVSTLGYGDIHPNNLYVQGLVCVQAISAVLLLVFIFGVRQRRG